MTLEFDSLILRFRFFTMIAQYFHYQIIEQLPLSRLEEFKTHARMRVFYHKGCKCVECGIEGTQLAYGKDKHSVHLDVYTDDFYPLTVDHIIPKSLGGSDDLDNLQPMCCLCNWKKGNGVHHALKGKRIYPVVSNVKCLENHIRNFISLEKINPLDHCGALIFKKVKKNKVKKLGYLETIATNFITKQFSILIKDKPESLYPIKCIFIKKNEI